ncbi:MAG: hypothetical protein HYZ34_03420 [Ignavibacteriae bacterium]|nr:hypothetical protein [Ignavibacteriota bacterium]
MASSQISAKGNLSVSVSIPDTVVNTYDTIDVPIVVGSLTGLSVFSYEANVRFDTTVLQFVSLVKTGTLSSDASIISNRKQDTVLVAASSTSVLNGSGDLIFIRFAIDTNVFGGAYSPLEFVRFQFNEGSPTTILTNGSVSFRPPQPLAPVLSSPANNSFHHSITPLLQWNDVRRAITYHLQISNSGTFDSTIVNDSTISTTSFQSDFLEYGKEYFWRVRAKNVSGVSSWSDVWKFTTLQRLTLQTEIHNGWNLLSLP